MTNFFLRSIIFLWDSSCGSLEIPTSWNGRGRRNEPPMLLFVEIRQENSNPLDH